MHHAVRVLAAIELRAAPFHSGIRRAFAEIRAVDARHALEIIEREDQRLVDEAVHDQPVIGRIDFGDAGMMPLEAEPVRRDDAVERMERREADRAFARGGEPFHVAADDVRLEASTACRRRAPRRRRRASASSPARSAAGWPDCPIAVRRSRSPPIAAAPLRQSTALQESAARGCFAPALPCLVSHFSLPFFQLCNNLHMFGQNFFRCP